MGRNTQQEDLPPYNLASEDGNVSIRVLQFCALGNVRGPGRVLNVESIRRRLDFDDTNDIEPVAGPSRETANEHDHLQNKSTIKWNFDFENEVPLPGDWLWEKVESKVPDTLGSLKSDLQEPHADD